MLARTGLVALAAALLPLGVGTASGAAPAATTGSYQVQGDPGAPAQAGPEAQLVIDRHGGQHVVGVSPTANAKFDQLVYYTRLPGAATWTRRATTFTVRNDMGIAIRTTLSSNGKQVYAFLSSCTGTYSTSVGIKANRLPKPKPIEKPFQCRGGGIKGTQRIELLGAAAQPHGHAMILGEPGGGALPKRAVTLTGTPGKKFAAPKLAPNLKGFDVPMNLVADPATGTLVIPATSRTKRGVFVFTRKPGHDWSRVRIPKTKTLNLVIDSVDAEGGFIAVGVHPPTSPDSAGVLVQTRGGKWTIVHYIRTHGHMIKVAINAEAKRVFVAYLESTECDSRSKCGIHENSRDIGGQAQWGRASRVTTQATDLPLQLLITHKGDPRLTYFSSAPEPVAPQGP